MAKKPKSAGNKWITFSSIAIQMGITIYLGNLLGGWLDETYDKDFWESTITLLAIFLSMFSVIIRVIKLSK